MVIVEKRDSSRGLVTTFSLPYETRGDDIVLDHWTVVGAAAMLGWGTTALAKEANDDAAKLCDAGPAARA